MKFKTLKYKSIFVIVLFIIVSNGVAQQQDSLKLPFAIANEKRMPDDELAEKKEGLSVTGVPDLSSDPVNGFGAGAEGSLFFNGKKSDPFFAYTPYRAELNVAVFVTTKLQREIKLGLDIPYIFNTKWRLRGEAAYEVNPNLLYFGITEKSLAPLVNPQTGTGFSSYSDYSNSLKNTSGAYYNTYTKKEAVLNLSMERSFYEGRLRTLIGYEIGSVNLTTPLNSNSLLEQDANAKNIVGFGQNLITFTQLGLIYDTRDLETDPS